VNALDSSPWQRHIPGMQKRVHIALAVLLVILVGLAAWLGLRQREPVYQGKGLSIWLESRYKGATKGNQDERQFAEQAIRQIGTNALPVLIEWLGAQDTRLKQVMITLAAKQKVLHLHLTSAEQRRAEAVWGYEVLGPLAVVQVPRIMDILTNEPCADLRRAAGDALAAIGPEARVAAPALFCATKDRDRLVRVVAFMALARIRPDPPQTIPVLAAGLDDPFLCACLEAGGALMKYGPEARAAVPALVRMLAQNNAAGYKHQAAANALKAIDPDAAAKAGVK